MNLLEKLKASAAAGIDWAPFIQTVHEMCAQRGLEHSVYVVGQLLTAGVALFDDGNLTDSKRRETWETLCKTAFDLVEIAHQEGRLTKPSAQPPQ